MDRYEYRGYADPTLPLDQEDKWMGGTLFGAMVTLAFAENEAGNTQDCRMLLERLHTLLPVERIDPPQHLRDLTKDLCVEVPDTASAAPDTIQLEANSGE
jgi:hypothetical protein